jgi:signal transduction histidine kinase/DNA-binding response OmpR family regulator
MTDIMRSFARKLLVVIAASTFLIALPKASKATNNTKNDSLTALLNATPKAARGPLYLQLSSAHGLDHPTKAYLAAEQAVDLGLASEDSTMVAQGYLLMGRWKRYIGGEGERVHSLFNAALQIGKQLQHPGLQCDALYEMARLAWWDYDRAKYDSLLIEAASLLGRSDDPTRLGKIAYLTGHKLYHDYKTEQAIAKYSRAVEYFEAAGNIDGIIENKIRISVAMLRFRRTDESARYQEEALVIAKANQSSYWTFMILVQKGLVLTYSQDAVDATELKQVLNQIEELSSTSQNQHGQMKYNYFKSRRLRDTGAGDEAIPYAEEFLRLSKDLNLNTGIVQATLFLCSEYRRQGLSAQALETALEVKELTMLIKYHVNQLYTLISKLYGDSGEPAKALEIRQQGVAFKKGLGNELGYYFYYFYWQDYAALYAALDNLGLAAIYQDSALAIARENGANEKVITALVGKGSISWKLGAYEDAQQELEEALILIQGTHAFADETLLNEAYGLGAQLYFSQKDYHKSVYYGELALASSKHIEQTGALLMHHEILWQAYEGLGKGREALQHMKRYNVIKDSVLSADLDSQLLALKQQYESEQKELQIDLLKQDKAVGELLLESNEASLQRSRIFNWTLAIAALTAAVLGWLFFNRFKLKGKAKELQSQNKQYKLEQDNIKAAQQLEMVELRSSFLANVSHEIRTPLTLIKGPLELWKQNPETINVSAIENMEHHADRLMTLVNEAMDVARSETATLPLMRKAVEVSPFFRQQFNAFNDQALKQGVALKFVDESEDITCSLDAERLERVVINLMSNALRYTPKNGHINLTLKNIGEEMSITVADTGAGIEAQHLPHIFDRYYRADKDDTTGYGIGLAIVKEVVEMHGGSITVESELGRGTTFCVALPVEEREDELDFVRREEEESDFISNDADNDRATVLVVEDNLEVQQYLVDILSNEYRVLTANDGQEGEELAIKVAPDLIVSDVMMPRKDGFEMLAALKSELLTSHIPIVLLTAKAAHEDKLQGLEAGADHYLLKPFSPEELRLCLRNLLKHQTRLRRQFGKPVVDDKVVINTRTKIDQEFLTKAELVVEQNMDNEEFNIEKFCAEMALNRTSVHLKLKALTDMNTSAFIKSIRVRKAAALIDSDAHSLAEIGDMTGFNNRQSFNRAFKEQLGMPPSTYRDRAVAQIG